MYRFRFIYFCSLFLFSYQAQALQFSANAVMSVPGRADVSTYLYYSSGRIRKEFFYYGEPVIQILDANKHISLMCFTDQQICYENKTLEEIHIGIENSMTSPCENNPALVCENLGKEALNKRQATKWKIVAKQGEKEMISHMWLDTELNIPIKQILFNGTTIELKWLGEEKLNNRATDKWVQQIKLADGQTQESYQWFDKELKISIRETFQNGNSQELQHIVVDKIEEKLFSVPVGFDKQGIEKAPVNPINPVKK